MARNIIFFSHIPKTGGTSLNENMLLPHFKEDEVLKYRGVNSLIKQADNYKVKYVSGHYPYGIHMFYPCNPFYVTFLRNPIDHLISNYYFIRQSRYSTYVHPKYHEAACKSLIEFYQKETNVNIQTKYLSGFFWYKLSNFVSLPGKTLLSYAKKNIAENYFAFGILEEYELSVRYMEEKLQMKSYEIKNKYKVTRERPRLSDLSEEEVSELARLNSLDMTLYQYARKLFYERALNQ